MNAPRLTRAAIPVAALAVTLTTPAHAATAVRTPHQAPTAQKHTQLSPATRKAVTTRRAVPARRTSTPALKRSAPRIAQRLTTNWAGYQIAVKAPRAATATWAVPNTTWPGRDGHEAEWVGIGGGTSARDALIQAGTGQDIVCTKVVAKKCTQTRRTTYAWIETYPSRPLERITNLPIAPGDVISATVGWSATTRNATFAICNERLNQCVTADRTSAAPGNVAEAIVERPADLSGRPMALSNFGRVTMTAFSATGAGGRAVPGSAPTTRIAMMGRSLLASTGALGRGQAFTVQYHRSV